MLHASSRGHMRMCGCTYARLHQLQLPESIRYKVDTKHSSARSQGVFIKRSMEQQSEKIAARTCLESGRWYVARIDELLGLIQHKPRLDEDEVQQCQAMLREILARFRADRRPQVNAEVPSTPKVAYLWAVNEAGDRLRVAATGRPNRRWVDDLTLSRQSMLDYLSRLDTAK